MVLEGWLLQASSKNCELGNRSVQLGSRCGMKHTKPSARRMWIIDKKKKREEKFKVETETELVRNRGKLRACAASDSRC